MSDLTWLWGQWTWTDVAPDSHLPVTSTAMCQGWFCSFLWSPNSPYYRPSGKWISNLCEDSLKQSHGFIFLIWKKLLMFQNLLIFLKFIFKNSGISNNDDNISHVLLCLNFQLLVFSLSSVQLERKEACFGQQWWLSSGKNVTTLRQDFLPLFSLSCMPNKTVLCEGIYEGAVSSQVVCHRLVGSPFFLLGCFVIPHTGYLGNRWVVMLVYERKWKHVRCQLTSLLIIVTLMEQCCCRDL